MKQNFSHTDDTYFEALEDKIFSRIRDFEKKRKQRRDILTKIVLPSILLFIVLSIGFSSFQTQTTETTQTTQYLAYNDALEYLDISDYEVDVLISDYGTETTNNNDDAIINYLSDDNSIDYEIINENF